ncbi:MAG: hypothetical protein HY901_21080 [Deltaproteobacteria bacterium]|nr:hypothetical protein [Deltaproteobacteria bacterium]
MKLGPALLVAVLALLASPAHAAAPTRAAPKGKTKAAPSAQAKPADDADLAAAGKVIEIDPQGNATVVKGEAGERRPDRQSDAEEMTPAPVTEPAAATAARKAASAGGLSAAEACRLRFGAQCAFLKRCAKVSLPLDCPAMIAACEQTEGEASFARQDAEACAKGVKALACAQADTSSLAAFNPESQVPACRPLRDGDRAEQSKASPTTFPDGEGHRIDVHDVDIGGALVGGP